MANVTEWLDQVFYPKDNKNWDDALFRLAVRRYLVPTAEILEIGASRGALPHVDFRKDVRRIVGIDPNPMVLGNPYLHEAHVGIAEDMPFQRSTFDVVYANNVLEHVERPDRLFSEVQRVLRKNGVFIVKTPNKYHYAPFIARMTSLAFHRRYNQLRGRKLDDTYPTLYRINSEASIRAIADRVGLTVEYIDLIERRPEYTRLFSPLYACGILYERIVNSSELFRNLRLVMIAAFRKTSDERFGVQPNIVTKKEIAEHLEPKSRAVAWH